MALTNREFNEMAAAVERMSARNGYRIPVAGEQLSRREQNLLREELGWPVLPPGRPSRTMEEVSVDLETEFVRRRRP